MTELAMAQLRGLSRDRASLFGMPHVGCEYTSYETGAYRVLDGERCLICGRAHPLNAHHIVPRSVAHTFPLGGVTLRSPLLALCGSGTTGCHDGFHGGARYSAAWEWDTPEGEDAWWSGELLRELGPHSDGLFRFGRYVIEDRRLGLEIHIRGWDG